MDKTVRQITFLLVLAFSVRPAFAQNNSELLPKVLKQLHLQKEDIFNAHFQNNFLPYTKNKIIVAFAKPAGEVQQGLQLYDAYILLVDRTTGQILNKFYEPDAWISDALYLSHITTDTTIYNLSNKVRAFGIRVSYRGSSKPDPFAVTNLSLFIPDGKTLKRVLKDYPIYRYHGTFGYKDCASNYSRSDTCTITVDKQHSHHSFYDLIIKEKKVTRTGLKEGCDPQKAVQHKTIKLTFAGKEYPNNKGSVF